MLVVRSTSQFPFHSIFLLLFPASALSLIPAKPTALPSAQEQGKKVAQQLIPLPLLLWWISRDAVRAGQKCKHQPPFTFPPPALQPLSSSQLHTDLPPLLSSLLPLVPCFHKVSPWANNKVQRFRANTTCSLLWIFCGGVTSVLKKPIPEFQMHHSPSCNHMTAILGSSSSYNAAKGRSVCMFVHTCVF